MHTRQSTCACLATLYLSLDEMRTIDNLSFTSGLLLLRGAAQKAMTVLRCHICPTKLVWGMQNAQLLNTLILSLAEAYQGIVSAIDTEAQRAESKTVWFGDVEPGSESGSLTLTLSPAEWRKFSKRAVKAEIYGVPHSSSTSFFGVLQAMEDRQIGWHASMPPLNFRCQAPGVPHHGEPVCVMLVRQARGIITRLPLDE
jgi:hypothetical protein